MIEYHLDKTGVKGFSLFNDRQFFRCHDAFEEVWRKTTGEERHYYQGLIQIAVAFYKIEEEKNWRGATSLLDTGIGYLKSVAPERVEIDIMAIITECGGVLARLRELGPERIGEIDPSTFPKLKFRVVPDTRETS
jgi:predicted metal-dependent hydrolase